MTQRTPQQVLDAALAHLEEHGWTRRGNASNRGPCCVEDALRRVTSGFYSPESQAAADLLRERIRSDRIYDWNDRAKDFSEVRAVMKGTGNE